MSEAYACIRRAILNSEEVFRDKFPLQLDKKGKTRVTHHNKLKPYEGDDPPSWLRKAKKKLSSSVLQRQ